LQYASSTASVLGAVKEEVEVVAAGTMLQGAGTGPVSEAGAEAGTEAVAGAGPSSMSMSQCSKSGATELVGATAKARAGAKAAVGAFVSTPNVAVAKGNGVEPLLIAWGMDTFAVEATEEEETEALAEDAEEKEEEEEEGAGARARAWARAGAT